jgi:hypothetical protein
MAKATPMKKKAVVRIAFNRVLEDGLNYKGWDLLFAPGLQATNRGGSDWVLVHRDSGLLVGPTFRVLDEAMEFARRLAPITDWTQPKEAVQVLEVSLHVHRLINEEMARRFAAAQEVALAA